MDRPGRAVPTSTPRVRVDRAAAVSAPAVRAKAVSGLVVRSRAGHGRADVAPVTVRVRGAAGIDRVRTLPASGRRTTADPVRVLRVRRPGRDRPGRDRPVRPGSPATPAVRVVSSHDPMHRARLAPTPGVPGRPARARSRHARSRHARMARARSRHARMARARSRHARMARARSRHARMVLVHSHHARTAPDHPTYARPRWPPGRGSIDARGRVPARQPAPIRRCHRHR